MLGISNGWMFFEAFETDASPFEASMIFMGNGAVMKTPRMRPACAGATGDQPENLFLGCRKLLLVLLLIETEVVSDVLTVVQPC